MKIEDVRQEMPVDESPSGAAGRTQSPIGTPVERAASVAREQAVQAAEALRRGELMHDAAVDPEASGDDRLIAMLAYVVPFAMPLIILWSESSVGRRFQRYHAVQSLALSVVFLAIGAAVSIGTAILQAIPVIGLLVALVVLCLTPIAFLMALIAMLYYGYQAYQGKRFAIPGLTTVLRDQGWIS